MLPTPQQVHFEARDRAFRCRRMLVRPEDIQQAVHSLVLKLNYDLVTEIDLSKRARVRLGTSTTQRCRYCLRSRPETKFSHESHTIPECLGGHQLISDDECDRCNQIFSERFEVHLDRMTRPMRAFLGIKGKRKPPKFETKDKATQLRFLPDERRYVVLDRPDSKIVKIDEVNKRYTLRLPCEPFSRLEVYRALAKIGFAILPPEELPIYEHVRQWLSGIAATPGGLSIAYAVGNFAFNLSTARRPAIRLWRRKWRGIPCPRFVVDLVLPRLAFTFPMPPFRGEVGRTNTQFVLPVPDLSEQPGWGLTEWSGFDLRKSELETEFVFTAVMTYETTEAISTEELLRNSGLSLPA